MFKSLKSLVAVMAMIFALALVAYAAFPVSKSLALPGGATNVATWSYTEGESRSAFSAFHPAHFLVRAASAVADVSTVTVAHVRSSVTNTVYSFTVASNGTSAIYYPSNTFYWLRGDVMVCTFSATNAATLYVTALEE